MRIHLSLNIETDGFALGIRSVSEAKHALAGRLRSLADRVEATNDENCMGDLVDDASNAVIGAMVLQISEGAPT